MSTPIGHSLAGISICFFFRSLIFGPLRYRSLFVRHTRHAGPVTPETELELVAKLESGAADSKSSFVPTNWWKTLVFCAIMACLPDIDFLPGILIGNMNYYHHKGTHSIFFAFVASLIVWAVLRKKNGMVFCVLTFILILSHLAIDYIAIDGSAPFGIPLLWPFSMKYFYFKYAFLPQIVRGDSVISVFNMHNLYAVAVELIIFLPIAFLSLRGWRAVRLTICQR